MKCLWPATRAAFTSSRTISRCVIESQGSVTITFKSIPTSQPSPHFECRYPIAHLISGVTKRTELYTAKCQNSRGNQWTCTGNWAQIYGSASTATPVCKLWPPLFLSQESRTSSRNCTWNQTLDFGLALSTALSPTDSDVNVPKQIPNHPPDYRRSDFSFLSFNLFSQCTSLSLCLLFRDSVFAILSFPLVCLFSGDAGQCFSSRALCLAFDFELLLRLVWSWYRVCFKALATDLPMKSLLGRPMGFIHPSVPKVFSLSRPRLASFKSSAAANASRALSSDSEAIRLKIGRSSTRDAQLVENRTTRAISQVQN